MRITDDQHRRIGEILGLPSCCVEEWIADRHRASLRRCVVVERSRMPAEVASINDEVSMMLGRRWETFDRHKVWVLCSDCSVAILCSEAM